MYIFHMTLNKVKITLIRRYKAQRPWRNEYYFQKDKNGRIMDLMEIILPYNQLLSQEQLNYITKKLNPSKRSQPKK